MNCTGFLTAAPLAARSALPQAKCARSTTSTGRVTMMADDKPKNPLAGLGGMHNLSF